MHAKESLPPEVERFWRTEDGLTASQRAEAYGIDLSLLEENLRRTPLERIILHDRARKLMESVCDAKLKRAGA